MHAGEFGIVYKAYLCGWERKDSIVAVKTLRGITHMCIIIIIDKYAVTVMRTGSLEKLYSCS